MTELIFEYINLLNGNKFFWGITMLLLNFGSRYLIGDLGKFHERILGNEIAKKIITFSLFFVATRDVVIAFILTILYVIIVDGILHEKRNFNIVPSTYTRISTNENNTDEEYKKAKEIVKKYEASDVKDEGKVRIEGGIERGQQNIYELYKEAVISL